MGAGVSSGLGLPRLRLCPCDPPITASESSKKNFPIPWAGRWAFHAQSLYIYFSPGVAPKASWPGPTPGPEPGPLHPLPCAPEPEPFSPLLPEPGTPFGRPGTAAVGSWALVKGRRGRARGTGSGSGRDRDTMEAEKKSLLQAVAAAAVQHHDRTGQDRTASERSRRLR